MKCLKLKFFKKRTFNGCSLFSSLKGFRNVHEYSAMLNSFSSFEAIFIYMYLNIFTFAGARFKKKVREKGKNGKCCEVF